MSTAAKRACPCTPGACEVYKGHKLNDELTCRILRTSDEHAGMDETLTVIDGWIDWRNGVCPVEANTIVEVRLRDGHEARRRAGSFTWSHEVPSPSDIVGYRLVGERRTEQTRHPGANAALETLRRLGYHYEGGELWKPPLGKRPERKHSHYFKSVAGLDVVDVYRVLQLFEVTDQALGHAIKKLLVAGGRGAGKDIGRDVQEAIDTLLRWQEMQREVSP